MSLHTRPAQGRPFAGSLPHVRTLQILHWAAACSVHCLFIYPPIHLSMYSLTYVAVHIPHLMSLCRRTVWICYPVWFWLWSMETLISRACTRCCSSTGACVVEGSSCGVASLPPVRVLLHSVWQGQIDVGFLMRSACLLACCHTVTGASRCVRACCACLALLLLSCPSSPPA
jgi:hypothetical protein